MQITNLNSVNTPCELSLEIALSDGSLLTISSVVRVIPNKRLVCKALWQKEQDRQPVYAKVFIGADAAKYAQRDRQGVERLIAARIATPALLWAGRSTDSSQEILLFSEISNSENVEVLWNSLPLKSEERFKLAVALVKEVAKHHHQGLLQTDLYLKNFLYKDNVIYTLDGDGIRPLVALNDGQLSLRNLSALLSKFDVLELEKWLAKLIKAYVAARKWQTAPRLELIQHLITVHRNKVTNAYASKKVFRTCTDVQVTQTESQYLAVARPYVANMTLVDVAFLDKSLQQPDLKDGNTCTVGLLQTNDAQKIVIKRYNVKSFWHGLLRSVRTSRAAISWGNAHRLKLLGLPTVEPVSLIEERFFFGRLNRQSFFLSEYLNGVDADVFFATEHDKEKRSEMVKSIVELFYRMYLLDISHGDMKANNIKIVGKQPTLIDLDSMKQHRFRLIAKHRHARDLRRFMRNWQQADNVDERLLSAFKKVFKVVYVDHAPLKLAGI